MRGTRAHFARPFLEAAYEYTVDHVGEDVDSGPLWLDFVGFLKTADPTHLCPTVKPEQAQSARMQEVRRAYQRAVSVPTNSIDALYREYDAFEHGVSPTLAKALLVRGEKGKGCGEERQKRFVSCNGASVCIFALVVLYIITHETNCTQRVPPSSTSTWRRR